MFEQSWHINCIIPYMKQSRKSSLTLLITDIARTVKGNGILDYYQCICGNKCTLRRSNVTSGNTTNCGCKSGRKKHSIKVAGLSEYNAYKNMINRCYRKTMKCYPNYGGRGITVCKRWLDSFDQFYADVGPRPSNKHSLDRKNNNEGYKPDNCHWVTRHEQNINQRLKVTSLIVNYKGNIDSLGKICRQLGFNNNQYKNAWKRIVNKGQNVNEVIDNILARQFT